jgi:PPOX class probable F420-dependent enzyme
MAVQVPENVRDLLQRPVVAALATLMPTGQPQVTPVWVGEKGDHLIINTARGRQKDRNMENRSKVTLLLIDPNNPYHWAEIRGTVDEVTEEGAEEDIRQLAKKYRGKAEYDMKGETRVTYKIAIEKVNGS